MNHHHKAMLMGMLFPLLLGATTYVNSAPKQCRHHNDALEQDKGLRQIANIPLKWKNKE